MWSGREERQQFERIVWISNLEKETGARQVLAWERRERARERERMMGDLKTNRHERESLKRDARYS